MNDSGIVVTPEPPKHDELESPSSNSDSSNASNRSAGRRLGINATEFISYSLFKIWYTPHKSSPKANISVMPIIEQIPEYEGKISAEILSPAGTENWFPQLVAMVEGVICESNSPTSIIFIALLYISRLRSMIVFENETPRDHKKLYQLFVLTLMVASKNFMDYHQTNKDWQVFSKISARLLTKVERMFLQDMRWAFNVNQNDYDKWMEILANLGREHVVLTRAVMNMDNDGLKSLISSLSKRPDLVSEILAIRKSRGLC